MSGEILFHFVLLGSFFVLIAGDIYMHNPRGSNNRNDERGRRRSNPNRLFDSQNNNRGGHNSGSFARVSGKMIYYTGSTVRMRWANQHSSGDENNNANVVIQYMCDENLRDGTRTRKIPLLARRCREGNCDTDASYGHHESLTYYEQCASQERNMGLFISNRNLRKPNRQSARSTRQNNGGNRRGYECPQERDYYPYFGPTPWRDIAVLTDDLTKCPLYLSESENVKSRWGCALPETYWNAVRGKLFENNVVPVLNSTQDGCGSEPVTFNGTAYTPVWKEFRAHRIPPPECLAIQYSRDNHQGNTLGGQFLEYNWTIPENYATGLCALRIRYNISTNDYDYWDTDSSANGRPGPREVFERLGFSEFRDARRRGYFLRGNPKVDVFNLRGQEGKFRLQLALNTAQYGRTFQDRSHAFQISDRPAEIPESATIHNLNVQGKRGNIVQVYPSVMYDFVPGTLQMNSGDYVHIQWTGSNNNNPGNTGQGRLRTDRNNLVQLTLRPYAEGESGSSLTLGTNYIRTFAESNLWGMSEDSLRSLAFSGRWVNANRPGPTLDRDSPYFNMGPVQVNQPGVHYFVCSRNNNFTLVTQKGGIIVE